MIRELAAIAEQVEQSPRFGRDVGEVRGRLEALPDEATANEELPIRGSLGEALLEVGEIDDAIETLQAVLARLDEASPENRPQLAVTTLFLLGLSHLRKSVSASCIDVPAGRCRLPPTPGEGLREGRGARIGAGYFLELGRRLPADHPVGLAARWLLEVAVRLAGDRRDAVPSEVRLRPDPFRSHVEFPLFRDMARDAGLATVSFAGGASVEDYDGDGLLDVFVSSFHPAEQARVFVNRGDGSFDERTREANLDGITGGLNVVHADYDDDGDVDVLVLRGAWLGEDGRWPNSLLRNDGGRFTDVTFASGLGDAHHPTQAAAWADYDLDGDLDLYIGNETTPIGCRCPSELFENRGDGTFVDVAADVGLRHFQWTKGVAWGDYDDDGDPDLYVSNLSEPNRLYRNDDGTFVDVAPELGVTGPQSSFVPWFWDVNDDGALDLLVNSYLPPRTPDSPPAIWLIAADHVGVDTPAEFPRLYLGDGHGGFREVGADWGLRRITLPMGANYGDLDNDGRLDFYLGTGYPGLDGVYSNSMFRNHGGGFTDITADGGFGVIHKGHGVAFADIDNDGDQDVFEQLGGFLPPDRAPDGLFANPGFGNHWINLELRGVRSNHFAVGARIRVDVVDAAGRARSVHRTIGSGGSFGANPFRAEIGLGDASAITRLEIRWPAPGPPQVLESVPLDRFLRITEGRPEVEVLDPPTFRLGAAENGLERAVRK